MTISINPGNPRSASYVYAPNAVAETVPAAMASGGFTLPTGTLSMGALFLDADTELSQVGFVASGGAVSPTHWWMCLVDNDCVVQAVTADQTTAPIATQTWYTLALTAPHRTTYSGLYYLGFMVAATQTATIVATAAPDVTINQGSGGPVVRIGGTSGSGLTTPPSVGTSVAAPQSNPIPYLFVS